MSQTRVLKDRNIELIDISNDNIDVYLNLARSYEAEFSNLTQKMPNELGVFEPDTMPVHPYSGYLLYEDKTPIGFGVIELSNQVNDVAEFYIIPSMRKNKLGCVLASTIFDLHPGKWQVRQIEGADVAKAFWRRVINQYTQNDFIEDVVSDPVWGVVTRQKFISSIKKPSVDGLSENGVFYHSSHQSDVVPGQGSAPGNNK
ncbi:MAG: hypothetical protein WAW86_02750 [Gammaproteobacteria bacterium]